MRRPYYLLLLTLSALAQPQDKLPQVDQIFSAFNNHTPGCAVGVAHQGQVVVTAGYGMADLERNVPITPASIFESGSVAKQFTAAALMLAEKQGKLSLDDPLRKYLPELPDYGTPVTIRQVISHLSGLRDWRTIGEFRGLPEGRLVYTNQDLLEMAAMQRALNYDPGTRYSYSNTGFNIAAILIERALGNGTTFSQFTRDNIFQPLGMTHTKWRDNFRAVVPHRALAYNPAPHGAFTQDTPLEDIIGAGGMLTTVGDLLRWNENFTHAKLGGPDFVKAQQTQAVLANGRRIRYAAGLQVGEWDGIREISHGGATGGYRTWLGRYPDHAVSIAVLCNSSGINPAALARATARLWTNAQPAAKPTSTFSADPTTLSPLAGLYRNPLTSMTIEVKWTGAKLTAFGGDLTPTAAGQFSTSSEQKVYVESNRLRVVGPNEETIYERVQPAHPTAADLAAYAGKYASPETASTLTIAPNSAGSLNMRIANNPPVELRPTYKDAFATPTQALLFRRDVSGKITGLTASGARTWNIRFTRVP